MNRGLYPAETTKGAADWLLNGEVPGLILVVPLAPSGVGDESKCRPMGVYQASERERGRYLRDLSDGGEQ